MEGWFQQYTQNVNVGKSWTLWIGFIWHTAWSEHDTEPSASDTNTGVWLAKRLLTKHPAAWRQCNNITEKYRGWQHLSRYQLPARPRLEYKIPPPTPRAILSQPWFGKNVNTMIMMMITTTTQHLDKGQRSNNRRVFDTFFAASLAPAPPRPSASCSATCLTTCTRARY